MSDVIEAVVVDARGLSCPQPIIATRRVLVGRSSGVVSVLVDTGTQRDNVARLAAREGWDVAVEPTPDGGFRLALKK
jgi:tRNA 2-thiouridine synthesizing protein A